MVSDDAPSELHFSYLLEVVFGTMVLLIGLHVLEEASTKVEWLKKELKVCYVEVALVLIPTFTLSLSPFSFPSSHTLTVLLSIDRLYLTG